MRRRCSQHVSAAGPPLQAVPQRLRRTLGLTAVSASGCSTSYGRAAAVLAPAAWSGTHTAGPRVLHGPLCHRRWHCLHWADTAAVRVVLGGYQLTHRVVWLRESYACTGHCTALRHLASDSCHECHVGRVPWVSSARASFWLPPSAIGPVCQRRHQLPGSFGHSDSERRPATAVRARCCTATATVAASGIGTATGTAAAGGATDQAGVVMLTVTVGNTSCRACLCFDC